MSETTKAYNQFCSVCEQQLVIERDLEGLPETGCPACDFAERREAMTEAIRSRKRPLPNEGRRKSL